jgi:hypothetical protein
MPAAMAAAGASTSIRGTRRPAASGTHRGQMRPNRLTRASGSSVPANRKPASKA